MNNRVQLPPRSASRRICQGVQHQPTMERNNVRVAGVTSRRPFPDKGAAIRSNLSPIALNFAKIGKKKGEWIADLKVVEDTQKAKADAAYMIQQQEQQKTVNEKTVEAVAAKSILEQEKQKVINSKQVEAQIEKAKREQELTAEKVKIQQNMLEAEIQKKADADKYNTEISAAAELEQRKRNAEAAAYEAEQNAKAVRALAEAEQYKMEQEAIGKKKIADAEAYAIEQKGKAEAEALRLKAEAYKEYGDAAKAQMVIEKLPEIAASIAEPIAAIKDVRIYGNDGKGVAEMSGNVPTVIRQTMDVVSDATGVNMGEIMKTTTLEGAVKRTSQKNSNNQ